MPVVNESLRFWDREVGSPTHSSWLSAPPVRLCVNSRLDPGRPCWPLDWLTTYLAGRRFRRALSVGCGTGALERDLVRRDLCAHVDAFDGSLASLAIARSEARREGISDRVRYFAADFNRQALPPATYDLVLFHQSLHHVARLERVLRDVAQALAPDGLLYLDEYVGPSRNAWSRRKLKSAEEAYRSLPRSVRVHDVIPFPIQADDPSEAVRSGQILPLLRIGFRVLARRGYGGNILSVVFPIVRWSEAEAGVIEELISAEERLLEGGASSYYTVLVARPRRGPAGRAARLAWTLLEAGTLLGRRIRRAAARR